ncbi:MAG TPA: bifunctional methylenetetrahydrofolate dehydrogenase/methenyltetrahydrofolate cyclohydrolase FolD [Alphaproteobacteria bacterium]|nr:bifunctional methylenetetrahydrofolate dehydrogenase/methenyltetrahydrofolate cyclohydrolase FolD [Alphaproteobacteria bacterium]
MSSSESSSARVIDGKAIAAQLRAQVAEDVQALGFEPGLAVILVGDDPASRVYVTNKIKACAAAGLRSIEHVLPSTASENEIAALIDRLNADPQVHGILLQLPLPSGLDEEALIQRIDSRKDVDGLTVRNIGRLVAGLPGLVPCTPQGAMLLIRSVREDLSGLHALVIGRSLLFGKPMAQLLLAENCTVTHAHSKTRDLPGLCAQADILVAAIGRPRFVRGAWIKPGAIVIDVGINRLEDGSLCGDVAFDEAARVARAITPVPGGVGPMTIACLLSNTVKAARPAQEEC